MSARKPDPIDVAQVTGLSDMPLSELQSLLPLCAQQELVATELLAARQADGADLLAREQALQLAIDAGWDGDTAALESEYSRLLPRLNTLAGMLQRRQEYVETLGRQAGIIRKYISQHGLAARNQQQAEKQQTDRAANAAAKAAAALRYQAAKAAAEKQKRKTAKADADAAYNRPLR